MVNVLDYISSPDEKLIKCGQLDEKILLELKMTTSLFNYIQVVTDYYDNDERPYTNNWTDIEGFGYGWAWLKYEEKDWHKMMSKMVSIEADSLIRNMDKILYYIYENEKVKTYHFIYLDKWREDIIISFSDEELYY